MPGAAPDPAALRSELVAHLRATGALRGDAVADAFAAVPREAFVPGVPLADVYRDRALVTHRDGGVPTSSSSQPAIMAVMLDMLAAGPGDHVLEVGAGTGYNAALLALIVGPDGRVTTVDVDAEIAAEARAHLAAAAAGDGRRAAPVAVVTGDGALGHPAAAPFDRVIVTAGAWALPGAWIAQLREGGRLVVPFRLNGWQAVLAFERRGAGLVSVASRGGGFMPLRGAAGGGARWDLPGGLRLGADVEIPRAAVDAVAERWDAARATVLPGLSESEPFATLTYLSLQGAPVATAQRPGPDGVGPSWFVLVTSDASALRWRMRPGAEGEPGWVDVEALGSDEALDFARAALARWTLEGRPGVEDLRVRVAPATGGSLTALPRPVAGVTRFRRGDYALECWFEPGRRAAP